MVAERHHVDAGIDEFAEDGFGDAEAAGGIFAVQHHQIERPVGDQAGQPLMDDGAPGAADHVADKQNAQPRNSLTEIDHLAFR